jgi:hypothetical protein
MTEKSSNVNALDELCKHYGMPRPHRLGGSAEGDLSILHQDPANIRVISASTGQELQAQPPRFLRVANWMKSLVT